MTVLHARSVSSAHARDRIFRGGQNMQMAGTKVWTLEELHSLPDDGNKYELIRGELFVTPAPAVGHETVLSRLVEVLLPYVKAHRLGSVYSSKPVIRREGSETQPDLVVGPRLDPRASWDDIPLPILVVEVASPTTRRRDRDQKRSFYMELGIPEYWMIDPESRSLTVIRCDHADGMATEVYVWQPPGAMAGLEVSVPALFE
jgi:Uma2 family endonuclease